MRRLTPLRILIPIAAASALLVGCSNTPPATQRTVTVVATVTSGSGAVAPSGSAGTGITVVDPSGSSGVASGSGSATATATGSGSGTAASSSAATSSAPPSSSTAATTAETAAPIDTKVDPLKADCSALFNAGDVKQFFGTEVPTATKRVRDVANPARKMTGKTRCLYGVAGNNNKVTIALSKYADAAAVTKQMGITREVEQDQGAVASTTKVSGYPADVLLRDGGLITVQYGSWSLAIAADRGVIVGNLAQKLEKAAETVLARVLKTA